MSVFISGKISLLLKIFRDLFFALAGVFLYLSFQIFLGLPVSALALVSLGTDVIGEFRSRRSVRAFRRYLDSCRKGPSGIAADDGYVSGGQFREVAEDIRNLLLYYQNSIVAVKNLWRKDHELGQDILSNSNSILEEVQRVSDSSDSLEKTAEKMDGKISSSKEEIDKIHESLEKARRIFLDQSTAVEESSASIEELISSIKSIASISEDKRSSLAALVEIAERGRNDIRKTLQAFSAIETTTASVTGFATLIHEIAEQTNLLSMNAAIEAAHAGDHGKGFAVVAGEIKKLAESSRKNASSISGTLKQIEENIDSVIRTSEVLEESIETILTSVSSTTASMEEIINGMTEMSMGTSQITTALSTLVEASQDAKRYTEDVQTASLGLQRNLGDIEGRSEVNVKELKTISGSVHRISESLTLLFNISDDNSKNLAAMKNILEGMHTPKRFLCDYIPPYQYIEEDRVTGVFTEILELLLNELGERAVIEFMPWQEALRTAREKSEIFLMTALRTKQREEEYHWIGPVVPDKHYLFRLSGRKDISVRTATDLKGYRLGNVSGNYTHAYFIGNGVPEDQIITVPIHMMNIQNLLLGKVDLIPMSNLQMIHQMKSMKRSTGDVEPAFLIDGFPTDAYMAVSRSTPDHILRRYEEAFDGIRSTGAYRDILAKYGSVVS